MLHNGICSSRVGCLLPCRRRLSYHHCCLILLTAVLTSHNAALSVTATPPTTDATTTTTITTSSSSSSSNNSVVFSLGGHEVRVQALSPTLFRVERASVHGVLNFNTNLAVNRSGFPGVDLRVLHSSPTQVTMATDFYQISVNTTVPPPPPPPPSPSPPSPPPARKGTCANIQKGYDAGRPVRASACVNGSVHTVPSLSACCALCDACNGSKTNGVGSSCTSTVFAPPQDSLAVSAGGAANCWLLSGYDGKKQSANRVLCSQSTPKPTMIITISDPTTHAVLWSGLGPDGIDSEPDLPSPADLLLPKTTAAASPTTQASAAGTTTTVPLPKEPNPNPNPNPNPPPLVYALSDEPRYTRPVWGATPAPSNVNLGPLANTSGFDTRFADGADAYFFVLKGAGTSSVEGVLSGYAHFRQEFLALTGSVPALPDWAFGLWFTWYHPYTASEKAAEMAKFRSQGISVDVHSLDMDWRSLVDDQDYLYMVNTTLFPDMGGFIANEVHAHGQKIYFNDHPAPLGHTSGHDAAQMSPAEVKFRYNGLTSIMSKYGLDFWWFDCHWRFSIPGVALGGYVEDYRAWGQSVYTDVMSRFYAESRPNVTRTVMLGCSNSNHPSNHRTPVWWTGDNQYNALATAIQDEVRYGLQLKPYVHPDCTGHHGADEVGDTPYPPEVYARWVQFCSLGTIFRIHSSHLSKGRRPWTMGTRVEGITRNFTNMRLKLLPTLVAAGHAVSTTGAPLVRRLDLEWPQYPEASLESQYMLADDMLVAPVDPFINCSNPVSGPYNSKRSVWLPPGTWLNAFSGAVHTGPGNITVVQPLETTPLFHRGNGALVTLTNPPPPGTGTAGNADWSHLSLDIFARQSSSSSQASQLQGHYYYFTVTRNVDLPCNGTDALRARVSITAEVDSVSRRGNITVSNPIAFHVVGSTATAPPSTITPATMSAATAAAAASSTTASLQLPPSCASFAALLELKVRIHFYSDTGSEPELDAGKTEKLAEEEKSDMLPPAMAAAGVSVVPRARDTGSPGMPLLKTHMIEPTPEGTSLVFSSSPPLGAGSVLEFVMKSQSADFEW